MVLSSFFWGYTLMQLPGVQAVRWLGAKRLVIVMALLSSLFTCLFVPAAALGWQGACAARAFLGVVQVSWSSLSPSSMESQPQYAEISNRENKKRN